MLKNSALQRVSGVTGAGRQPPTRSTGVFCHAFDMSLQVHNNTHSNENVDFFFLFYSAKGKTDCNYESALYAICASQPLGRSRATSQTFSVRPAQPLCWASLPALAKRAWRLRLMQAS